jgi:outer membrane beta-barrel protein
MFPLVLTLVLGTASAQETVDIGVIKQSDVKVVQKLLYPKEGRTEMGVHLGYMPFDAFTKAPNGQLSFDMHRSETFSFGVVAGAGYGFETPAYNQLETQSGVAYEAYSYLASGLAGVGWAPIYGKMNLDGANILHYDIYGAARAGATLERSHIPTGGMSIAPTISPAIGARFFTGDNGAIRIELRDDFMLEHRMPSDTTHLKQNVNISVGYSILSKLDGTGR